MLSFGLALGGGGVKGLAHIPLLKKLDALGAKPSCISGTSMGAIIGALYAAGLSGEEIEARVRDHLFSRKDSIKHFYKRRKHLMRWLRVFSFEKNRGGFINAEGLFDELFNEIVDKNFEDLSIPFTAIATNFHTGDEVALSQGSLLPAVQASMAVPGVFAPVKIDENLLVDGGLVNNVPCNHASKNNCPVIASDVISLMRKQTPKATEVLSGSLSIMLRRATSGIYEKTPPAILFQPDTNKIDAFDFHKIAETLERGEQALVVIEQALEDFFNQTH